MAGENPGFDSDEKSDDMKNVTDLQSDKLDAMSSRSDLLEFIPLSAQLINIVRTLDYKSVSDKNSLPARFLGNLRDSHTDTLFDCFLQDEDIARFKEVLT